MSNTLEGSSAEGHAMGIVDNDGFSDNVVDRDLSKGDRRCDGKLTSNLFTVVDTFSFMPSVLFLLFCSFFYFLLSLLLFILLSFSILLLTSSPFLLSCLLRSSYLIPNSHSLRYPDLNTKPNPNPESTGFF